MKWKRCAFSLSTGIYIHQVGLFASEMYIGKCLWNWHVWLVTVMTISKCYLGSFRSLKWNVVTGDKGMCFCLYDFYIYTF
jgi:hypothetical protein